MLAGADNLGGWVALADGRGAPAEAGDAELGREDGQGHETWRSIGVLAAELMEQIKDRAARRAPREAARAPEAGRVAPERLRRLNSR